MNDIYCFGSRPHDNLSQHFLKEGFRVVYAPYTEGFLSDLPSCSAVVLHWKSAADQEIVAEAKALGMPLVVVTDKLTEVFRVGEPFADLYLETPANNEEIIKFLVDMVPVTKPLSAKILTMTANV